MQQVSITSFILAFPLFLVGCGAVNDVEQAGSSAVGTGAKFIGDTGSAVGAGIGNGVRFLTGQTANSQDVKTYHQKGFVYRDGHKYKIVKGKYVLVK